MALLTHVLLLEKDGCGLFALLDGYFLWLGFEWSSYLEEVSNLLQFLLLANVKGANCYLVASFFALLKKRLTKLMRNLQTSCFLRGCVFTLE
jgi:hypothetical protein